VADDLSWEEVEESSAVSFYAKFRDVILLRNPYRLLFFPLIKILQINLYKCKLLFFLFNKKKDNFSTYVYYVVEKLQ